MVYNKNVRKEDGLAYLKCKAVCNEPNSAVKCDGGIITSYVNAKQCLIYGTDATKLEAKLLEDQTCCLPARKVNHGEKYNNIKFIMTSSAQF